MLLKGIFFLMKKIVEYCIAEKRYVVTCRYLAEKVFYK